MSIFLTRSVLTRSYVQFGGYSENKVRNNTNKPGDGIHWHQVTLKKHWQIKATDILIDDKSIFSGSTTKAVIKTSSPVIEIPYDDFRYLTDKLESLSIPNLTCTLEPPVCRVLGRCSSAVKVFKKFGFVFGDSWQYNPDLKDLLYDVTISKLDYC